MSEDCYQEVVHDMIERTCDLNHNKFKTMMVWDRVGGKYVGFWTGIRGGGVSPEKLQFRSWTNGLVRKKFNNSTNIIVTSSVEENLCVPDTDTNKTKTFLEYQTNHENRYEVADNESETESDHLVENPFYDSPSPSPRSKLTTQKKHYSVSVSCPLNCGATKTYGLLSRHLTRYHGLNYEERKAKCAHCGYWMHDATLDIHVKLFHSFEAVGPSIDVKNDLLNETNPFNVIGNQGGLLSSDTHVKQIDFINPELGKFRINKNYQKLSHNFVDEYGLSDSSNFGELSNKESISGILPSRDDDGCSSETNESQRLDMDNSIISPVINSDIKLDQATYKESFNLENSISIESTIFCCTSDDGGTSSSPENWESPIKVDTTYMKCKLPMSSTPKKLSVKSKLFKSSSLTLKEDSPDEDNQNENEVEARRELEWKNRRRLSDLEKGVLERVLDEYSDPSMVVKSKTAKQLGLPVRVVLDWFYCMKNRYNNQLKENKT